MEREIFAAAKREKINKRKPRFFQFTIALISAFGLAIVGGIYAHKILIPMLLEFLANDAANIGLSNTWQLQSWMGFIVGLFFGSIISFQTPLLVWILLRNGIVSRVIITENRGIIWFTAIVLGALLSPPDPLSMFLVGGPMILLLLEVALVLRQGNRVNKITHQRLVNSSGYEHLRLVHLIGLVQDRPISAS
jgi:Sec-independent protein secretion pathway component TatC